MMIVRHACPRTGSHAHGRREREPGIQGTPRIAAAPAEQPTNSVYAVILGIADRAIRLPAYYYSPLTAQGGY
eukprot:668691-Pleurochrysis_carterae.AAC.6